jgi:hypothetical protein
MFVISSRRGGYYLDDLAASLTWSAVHSHHVLAVDETGGQLRLQSQPRVTAVSSGLPLTAQPGFHRAAALELALEAELDFEYVYLLDEQCLVWGRGVDELLGPALDKDPRLGLVGVQERGDRGYLYRQSLPLLIEWRVPHERWEQPPLSLSPYLLVLPRRLALALRERSLLSPPGCERWLGHYGDYLSWVAQMLGYHVLSWGYTDKPLPPLLLLDERAGGQLPPTVISERMAVYAPACQVVSYAETELREIAKRNRGEPARPVQPLSPQVSPGPS